MSTPTTPEASLYAAGAKKAAVWGAAVALGAGYEIKLLKSANLPQALSQAPIETQESNNTFIKRRVLGGVSACDFDIEAYMRYDAGPLGEILACLFGTAGTPATVETGVYKHTFQWASSSLAKFVTYAEEYPGKIYEVPSAKPQKVVFSLQDGILKMTASMRGSNIVNDATTPAAVNTATEMDALTSVNEEDEVRFDELGAVWMDEHPISGGPDADNQKTVSGLEITCERGLETPRPAAGNATLTEAQEESLSRITVKLDFPYDDAYNRLFFEHFKDGSDYSLVLKFTGLLLGATQYYQLNLWFPRLVLWEVPDLTKDGLAKVTATFRAIAADSAPTGFAYVLPYAELQNARSSDYLA